MLKIRSIILTLVAISAAGVVLSASAYASPTWLVKGSVLKTSETGKATLSFGKVTIKWEDKTTKDKFEVECKEASGSVELKGGEPGTDKFKTLTFEECVLAAGPPGCQLKAGGVSAEELPGWPTELKSSGGKFYDLATGIKFSLILEKCITTSFSKTWLFTGNLEAEVKNETGKVKIIFPAVALGGSTLKAEGVEASLFTEGKLEEEAGGALEVMEEEKAKSGHQWLKNGSALTQTEPVLSSGGNFRLTASNITLTCETVTDTGVVLPGTMDETTSIHFLGCSTNKVGCDVSSEGSPPGLILVSNILTELTLKSGVLADEFKGSGTKKIFVALLFASLTTGACSPLPELVNMTGIISAKVENATEELNFPEPELSGNSLEINGVAGKLVGKDKRTLTNGGTLTAE